MAFEGVYQNNEQVLIDSTTGSPLSVTGGVLDVNATITATEVEIKNDSGNPVPVNGTVGLAAGTNNIGDVDVLTLPGSLTGKAEDSASASGDVGLAILGVRNDTQAALTSANADYGMLAIDSKGRLFVGIDSRTPLGYQQLTVTNVAASLTVPVGAVRALIQTESADVRWRDDGTLPTSSVGMRLSNGASMEYTGDLTALDFIRRTGSNATLNISYYDK